MLRVGILGKTDSARRKADIVNSSEISQLVETGADPRLLIEASDLVVLADGDGVSRAEVATLALRRGRHVFSDWPLAADLDTNRLLMLTAEESGVELAVNRPDRVHPAVLLLRDRAPVLTDVTLSAGRHYRFENLLTDAIDLCLFLNGGSGIHRYESEAVRDETGPLALSFSLRFHSGSLATGRVRKTDAPPIRTVFAAGGGWGQEEDLLPSGDSSKAYDPSKDERSFLSCIECLAEGQPVRTALHDLEETIRAVGKIMTRTRGRE
ncbi:MAG TPA: hypothetical protein VMO47_15385 [Rhodothermales bacterium]|nr:hypothetical protein [Rhodothermales bacterium]